MVEVGDFMILRRLLAHLTTLLQASGSFQMPLGSTPRWALCDPPPSCLRGAVLLSDGWRVALGVTCPSWERQGVNSSRLKPGAVAPDDSRTRPHPPPSPQTEALGSA